MTNYWVLQGNTDSWDQPESIYTQPTLGWSVTGVHDQVSVGDGVLIWLSNTDPAKRGIYAVGKVTGDPRPGFPKGWGSVKQRAKQTWFAPLAIWWYLTHNPVSVSELKRTKFSTNLILKMPRRTAYPCTLAEFNAAVEASSKHGPTSLPALPGDPFKLWWDTV